MPFFVLHAGFKAAALNHEAVDHAVKECAVVKAFLHIALKVCDGFRSSLGVELQIKGTEIGGKADHVDFSSIT